MSHPTRLTSRAFIPLVALVLFAAACGSSSDSSTAEETTSTTETTSEDGTASSSDDEGSDISALFVDGALTSGPSVVDCTLENGSETSCYEIEVASLASTVDTDGPFCPATTSDTGGIWVWDGEDPGLYALDSDFWAMMTEQGYEFADADGTITITDPAEGAASSSTTENSCLEATADGSFHLQVLLPVTPEDLDTATDLSTVSQVGVALDGVTIFGRSLTGVVSRRSTRAAATSTRRATTTGTSAPSRSRPTSTRPTPTSPVTSNRTPKPWSGSRSTATASTAPKRTERSRRTSTPARATRPTPRSSASGTTTTSATTPRTCRPVGSVPLRTPS